MSLIVSCSKCGKKFKVGEDKAGKKIKCTGCGAIVTIPAPASPKLSEGEIDLWDLPPAEDTSPLPPSESPPEPPNRTGARKASSKTSRSSKNSDGMPGWLKILLIVLGVAGGITMLACAGCYLVLHKVGTVAKQALEQASNDLKKDLKEETISLTEARKGFQTKLVPHQVGKDPIPNPPPELFSIVHYDAPAGKLAAYMSLDPKDGKKHPAIIWITGGDCNSIGDVWKDAPASNDQTAAAYRKAGILMMFPSLRGGEGNPGVKESFLGEVDDVLAANTFLAKVSYVDPGRIYLGGHSTGGTLVLLVAESSDRFRAIFSFGPADDVGVYGSEFLTFDTSNRREIELRSPARWLKSIKSPTFVFEGTEQGNLESLQAMAASSTNPKAHFFEVKGSTHFSILAPTNRLIAEKILRDDGPACNLSFTAEELGKLFGK